MERVRRAANGDFERADQAGAAWLGRRFHKTRGIALPARLGALSFGLACWPEWVHVDIGWRRRRRPLLTAFTVLFADAEVMLGVLMEIFCGYGVAADRRFPGEGDVTLEYLIGAAADFEVWAVAVEKLISLRCSMLLLEWPLAVKAPARALIPSSQQRTPARAPAWASLRSTGSSSSPEATLRFTARSDRARPSSCTFPGIAGPKPLPM